MTYTAQQQLTTFFALIFQYFPLRNHFSIICYKPIEVIQIYDMHIYLVTLKANL